MKGVITLVLVYFMGRIAMSMNDAQEKALHDAESDRTIATFKK